MSNLSQNFAEYVSSILAKADESYAQLPPDVLLQAQNLAEHMMEYAQRQLQRTGPGIEQYDTRAFREGIDDPRMISQKLSARHMEPIVIERQAEMKQPVFMWRKSMGSMNVQYEPNSGRLTKKEYADVILLAASMAISASEDKVGVLESERLYQGAQTVENLAAHFFDVNVIAGNLPVVNHSIPTGSNVILMSDFYFENTEEQNEFIQSLELLRGLGANGQAYMLVDPEELSFPFEGHVRFKSFSQNVIDDRQKAESLRDEFRVKMKGHIEFVSNIFRQNDFEFNVYRTDTKPIDLLYNVFEKSYRANALQLKM